MFLPGLRLLLVIVSVRSVQIQTVHTLKSVVYACHCARNRLGGMPSTSRNLALK